MNPFALRKSTDQEHWESISGDWRG